MIYRKNELEFLLKSAFGRTTVSLVEGQLKFGGDWYTNCTFRNIDLEHYSDLFRYVLLSDSENVEVIDKNEKKDNYIKRGMVMKGLEAYFLSYGVRNQIYDTLQGRTRVLDILTTKILPVILLSKSTHEKVKAENEDVEEQLLCVMDSIKQRPFSLSMILEQTPSARSIKIYDPNYPKNECNYEVRIPISYAIGARFQKYDEWLIREVACPLIYGMEASECDEVCMKQYIRYHISNEMDSNPDAPVERKLSYSYSDYVLKLHLSTYELDKNLIEGMMVKYKTKMDLCRLAAFKGYSQHQIENEIYQNGIKHISEQLTSEKGAITEYCNQMFLLMQDLINRASFLNMNNLISGEKIAKKDDSRRQLSIEDCKKEIAKVVVNGSQVTSALGSRHQKDCDYAEQCYLVIQSILQSHIQMLNHIGSDISKDFVYHIDSELINNHIKDIEKYERNLEKQQKFQETMTQNNPDFYKNIETITDLYTYRDPELLANYKAALETYRKSLKMEIKKRNAVCSSGEN